MNTPVEEGLCESWYNGKQNSYKVEGYILQNKQIENYIINILGIRWYNVNTHFVFGWYGNYWDSM